jgi:ABC-type multidrug transport system permease subunit
MPHEIASAVIEGVAEVVGDLASDKIKRRWGWQGCLSVVVVLAAVVLLVLWGLGAFAG